ncbi:amino acid transporter [Fimbriimonas ginsengisoli]
MCLTGVDYFSTLGYQPGIAALAAGALSPMATLILVLLTLFGALPIYKRVAIESPHGEGSIAMLEKLLPWWQGKLFVLALLGFVATDFVITITLSAADATAHLIENPYFKSSLEGKAVPVTLALVAILGAVFLKGFSEAVGIAVVLVIGYLALNAVVVFEGIMRVAAHPHYFVDWQTKLTQFHGGNPLLLLGLSLFYFPKLALGLSGFETGVAVMPLVKGRSTDTERNPAGRIKSTHRLLASAAIIMSVFLISSSLITTLLIPEHAFANATASHPAGEANGRALAYLAHKFFGNGFGTLYDVSTILILWFAGASAMAGLLNIVPRYLPRYGMAPEWTKAVRPLVLVFTGIAFAVTMVFRADVDAQGGAYATGVLVLMTSAAVAVTISARQRKAGRITFLYGFIAFVFAYTTIVNVYERPDGLRIASLFILTIVLISFVSRIWRTLELRVDRVDLDVQALNFVRDAVDRGTHRICLVPNRPEAQDISEYDRQDREARRDHHIAPDECVLFVEVHVPDASEFAGVVKVKGTEVGPYQVLRITGTAVPNAIAALALKIRDLTNERPHIYFNWGERHPALYLVKYLFSGRGDIAPLTREILRRIEPDPEKRPAVHVA